MFVTHLVTAASEAVQLNEKILLLTAGRDHRRPGWWHSDHPWVCPHLAAAGAAAATDPDCAVHGRLAAAPGQSTSQFQCTCTKCAGGGGGEDSRREEEGFINIHQAIKILMLLYGWRCQEVFLKVCFPVVGLICGLMFVQRLRLTFPVFSRSEKFFHRKKYMLNNVIIVLI